MVGMDTTWVKICRDTRRAVFKKLCNFDNVFYEILKSCKTVLFLSQSICRKLLLVLQP